MPANPDLAVAAGALGGGTKVTYKWTQFHGKEQTTEFDLDSHMSLEGFFQSNSSSGHKEYQDRLRAGALQKEGRSKSDIANILSRSERFVAKWWMKEVKEVPRPEGVHAYLALDHTSTYAVGVQKSANDDMDAATHWRDVELRRNYSNEPDVYNELLHNTDWGADVARTRDFRTGAMHLKYDKQGNIRMQGKQSGKYTKGSSPALERCLQKLFHEYGMEDRTSGVGVNWYPDGSGMLGSHRHDCWTALFSFGCDRILTIDNTPLLCRDGDMVIFGTQRHGVPLMPEITEGRITVPVFFYPDHLQKQAMWSTITDDADGMSSKGAKLKNNAELADRSNSEAIWSEHEKELAQLMQMGFEAPQAKQALIFHQFDVSAAAQLLLNAMPESCACFLNVVPLDEIVSKPSGNRWAKRAAASAASPSVASSDISTCADTDDKGADEEASIMLALQLEGEQTGGWAAASSQEMPAYDEADSASIALAMQLETEAQVAGPSPELLAAQFQQYETELDKIDAEDSFKTGMHGDLMASARAREHLKLDSMDRTILYSLGHGHIQEKHFFELLQLHSIRVLYDLRGTDYRQELHGVGSFTLKLLKESCKARGIFYKQMPIGREGAYGTLAHLKSDEAKHILIELLWQGKRRRIAFLGRDPDWHNDPRLAIAEVLVGYGHEVKHITEDGSVEDHMAGMKMPDFLTGEEERLKMLEKQRKAGELKRPSKASDSRSTEAVAKALTVEREAVDVGQELRDCENQTQLKFTQQRLARMQRVADEKGVLAKGKQLTHVPKYIKGEAQEQALYVAERKKMKDLAKNGPAASTELDEPRHGASASSTSDPSQVAGSGIGALLVECAVCEKQFPWDKLSINDGVCVDCSAVAPEQEHVEEFDGDLTVECIHCSDVLPWALLQLGDGACPKCFQDRNGAEESRSGSPPQAVAVDVDTNDGSHSSASHVFSEQAIKQHIDDIDVVSVQPTPSGAGSWRSRRRAQQSDATESGAHDV
jgi:hypothetical protein